SSPVRRGGGHVAARAGWAVHGIPGVPAARRRGPGRVAQAVRGRGGRGPGVLLRVRRLPHRSPAAPRGGKPGGGEPGRVAVPRGPPEAVARGGVARHGRRSAGPGPGRGAVVTPALELYRSVPRHAAATSIVRCF